MGFRIGDETLDVSYVAAPAGRFTVDAGGSTSAAIVHGADAGAVDVEVDGVRSRFTVVVAGDVVAVHGPRGTTELVEMAVQSGVQVKSLTVQNTTLDDVFVHYTGRQLRDELQKAYAFVMPQRPGLQP